MADGFEKGALRRLALAYLTDLVMAILVVLVCVRLLTSSPSVSAISSEPFFQFSAAVSRYTPYGLWLTYQDTLGAMLRDFDHTAAAGPFHSLLLGLEVLLLVMLAGPATLFAVYNQSIGLDTWMVMAAAVLTLAIFVMISFAWRPTFPRVVFAAAVSPLIASILFWVMQQLVFDAFDAVTWLAVAAPWCLACPVVCTLWWVLFPHAPHGAAATLLCWVGRLRQPQRRRRPISPIKPSPAGNPPH